MYDIAYFSAWLIDARRRDYIAETIYTLRLNDVFYIILLCVSIMRFMSAAGDIILLSGPRRKCIPTRRRR